MIGLLPIAVVGVALFAVVQVATAATLNVQAAADAALFEDATGRLANGSGANVFAGRTTNNNAQLLRRALVRFELSSPPAGAVVTSARVSRSLTRSRFAGDLQVDLHRVTASWSEGPITSARAFATRVAATLAHRPTLTVNYDAPPRGSGAGDDIRLPLWTMAPLAG
ncbi:MAG: hypothetical protein ACKVQQ_04375 [Burkholderiales bacterium]